MTTIASSPTDSTGTRAPTRSEWIVGGWYDSVFFIFSPLLALLAGIALYLTRPEVGHSAAQRVAYLLLPAFVGAHLFIVFFRSHGNREIFKRYPYRFTVVPVLLLAALLASPWFCTLMVVVAVWWDVYHSSLQTFGLSRLYDKRAGNDLGRLEVGYWLDKGLNLLLYAGPVLAGATLMNHVDRFNLFEEFGDAFFTAVPATVEGVSRSLSYGVLLVGAIYLVIYFIGYRHLQESGYRVPWRKVALLLSTGACSIYTWGFNSFGEAFLIMNLFHAVQYFALVWAVEERAMTKLFRLSSFPIGVARALTFAIFIVIAAGAGLYIKVAEHEAVSAFVLVSILHFWYDGFIWSLKPTTSRGGY